MEGHDKRQRALKTFRTTNEHWGLRWVLSLCHYFANKDLNSQSYGFSSRHVWMWELDHKEGWAPKTWCFWTVVLEKTLESPLDCKEIQPVNPKGNQPWILIGRTDAEAEIPILWPPDAKRRLIGKYSDAGEDGRQEANGTTEVEMVGWHHQLNAHELEQAPGVGEGQGRQACCGPQGHKELDTTKWLNNKCHLTGASQVVQRKRTHLPVQEIEEMRVRSQGRKDPLQ